MTTFAFWPKAGTALLAMQGRAVWLKLGEDNPGPFMGCARHEPFVLIYRRSDRELFSEREQQVLTSYGDGCVRIELYGPSDRHLMVDDESLLDDGWARVVSKLLEDYHNDLEGAARPTEPVYRGRPIARCAGEWQCSGACFKEGCTAFPDGRALDIGDRFKEPQVAPKPKAEDPFAEEIRRTHIAHALTNIVSAVTMLSAPGDQERTRTRAERALFHVKRLTKHLEGYTKDESE